MRFICGTQEIHKDLEAALSEFLGIEDTILYSSCFDANGGLFEALLGEEDAMISDELNHACIIDGIRLCKAQRLRYPNGDMDDLETQLKEAQGTRRRMIATDGVLLDGRLPRRPATICDLAERHDAMVMVDDSHAMGFIGPGGRGTPEHRGVTDRVDVVTWTLGKALGGATGGYSAARRRSSICSASAPARTCSRTRSRRRSSAARWRRSSCSRPRPSSATGSRRTRASSGRGWKPPGST